MPFLQQVKETLRAEYAGKKSADYNYKAMNRERLLGFRRSEESIVRVERPTNLPRARSLGYRAKQGIILARVRVRHGSGMHTRPVRARRPKRMGVNKLTRKISIQGIAEKRVNKRFPNCEVLNSYFVGKDGKNKYFEVILVDVSHPAIKSDPKLKWICEKQHSNRAERGLTSAQKKSRGLRRKGKGAEKVRPSLRAHDRTAK